MQYFVVHVIIQRTTSTLNFMNMKEGRTQIFTKIV